MRILLIGNCLFNRPKEILKARGYDIDSVYMANPVTLAYSDRIPEGLSEVIDRLNIADRLERRTLAYQFEGIAPEKCYDLVFVNYYQEMRPILRHKRLKYFLHINFNAVRAYEPTHAWEWITDNFDIVDTVPEKYLERFIGLVLKIRANHPKASIIIINKFYPVRALGPVAGWFCTEGQPFDKPYLDKMESWLDLITRQYPGIYFFHSENIMIDFLRLEGFNFQFLFPEVGTPASGCRPYNYIRDLEHPSDLYYQKLSTYLEQMVFYHTTGDREGLQRICRMKDAPLWHDFEKKSFQMSPMTAEELSNLFLDTSQLCQMVGLENTIQFDSGRLIDIDVQFTENLKQSRRFIELKNNFRTAFRIQPRESLIPALEMYYDFFKKLNHSKTGKNYYLVNVKDFKQMLDTCRERIPVHF